jgi:hypothetical protein
MRSVGIAPNRSRSFDEDVFGSGTVFEQSQRELKLKLEARGIYFGDGLLPTYVYAFMSAAEQRRRWATHAERFVEAMERMSKLLVDDDEFCATLGMDREALELVRSDPGYGRTCVLCRPDGIPVGDDIRFVELNSDSPAMMMFLDIVAECVLELDTFATVRSDVQPPCAADRLLDALLACYMEYAGSGAGHPTIAIADWEGQKTRFEHQRLAEHFEARGYETLVCDPRAFHATRGELRVGDRRVQIVYRRALSAELLSRRDEVRPLLKAYREGAVCMVNPLRSYMAGVKSVLARPEVWGGADLVPRTLLLDRPETRAIVASSPLRWALKRSQGHGGDGVVLPEAGTEDAWVRAFAASLHEPWIAQEYLTLPKISVPELRDGSVVACEKYFNWNPFVFGGKFAGSIVRVSDSPLINITLGGGLIPAL